MQIHSLIFIELIAGVALDAKCSFFLPLLCKRTTLACQQKTCSMFAKRIHTTPAIPASETDARHQWKRGQLQGRRRQVRQVRQGITVAAQNCANLMYARRMM